MDWVESKSICFLGPEFAEVFVGREAFECFETSDEVVGFEEVGQVRFELVVGVVEVSLDGGVFDGSIHALDLPVGPGVVGLGESVLDSMKVADPVEGVSTEACGWALPILRQIGELDAVVGEHGVDAVWNGFDERFEEGRGRSHVGFFDEFDHNELRGSVDGHEEVELALRARSTNLQSWSNRLRSRALCFWPVLEPGTLPPAILARLRSKTPAQEARGGAAGSRVNPGTTQNVSFLRFCDYCSVEIRQNGRVHCKVLQTALTRYISDNLLLSEMFIGYCCFVGSNI